DQSFDNAVIDRLDQTAALDQLGNLRTQDKFIEIIAQSTAVCSAWCGRQSDQASIWISFQDQPPGPCGNVVSLVDDDEICWRQWHLVRTHAPRPQGLNACHLHRDASARNPPPNVTQNTDRPRPDTGRIEYRP